MYLVSDTMLRSFPELPHLKHILYYQSHFTVEEFEVQVSFPSSHNY